MTSVLAKNAGKVIVHVTKRNYLVTTLYEVFNRLQAFLFSFLWGIKVEIQRKQILHSRVSPYRINSREIGKHVSKRENFNTRNTMTTIS